MDPGFWTQDRQVYYIKVNGTDKVGGYWLDNSRWNGTFTLMTVPYSGHFIPYNYYNVTRWVLRDFIADSKLSCHETDNACSKAHDMCSYMLIQNGDGNHGSCNVDG